MLKQTGAGPDLFFPWILQSDGQADPADSSKGGLYILIPLP